MKAVALDYFFAHHHSSFWAFIEKIIHFRRATGVQSSAMAEPKADLDFFQNVNFFEDEGDMEGYVRSFRE